MCLAVQYDDVQTEKLLAKKPNTITMWRVFNREKDGNLYSIIASCCFPRCKITHVCTPHRGAGVNGQGFHCFFTRKDARAIMKEYAREYPFAFGSRLVVRKVLVEKSDIVALGETNWYFDSSRYRNRTHTTRTAIVKAMVIESLQSKNENSN